MNRRHADKPAAHDYAAAARVAAVLAAREAQAAQAAKRERIARNLIIFLVVAVGVALFRSI